MTAASTAHPGALPDAKARPQPLFAPFRWADTDAAQRLGAHDQADALRFAAKARDVVRGMTVVLQLLEHVDHDRIGADPPLLDDVAAGDLLRLAAVAGELFDDEAENQLGRLGNSVATMQAAVAAAPRPGEPRAANAASGNDCGRAGHARG